MKTTPEKDERNAPQTKLQETISTSPFNRGRPAVTGKHGAKTSLSRGGRAVSCGTVGTHAPRHSGVATTTRSTSSAANNASDARESAFHCQRRPGQAPQKSNYGWRHTLRSWLIETALQPTICSRLKSSSRSDQTTACVASAIRGRERALRRRPVHGRCAVRAWYTRRPAQRRNSAHRAR